MNRILMCADVTTNRTFCVLLKSRDTLYKSCNNCNVSSQLTLGDPIVIYEPVFSLRTLGNDIPIITTWNCIVPLRRNLDFPQKPIIMDTESNKQIHFIQHGCSVQISMLTVIEGGENVPCISNTCDRQLTDCKGCTGAPHVKRNFVFSCYIDVQDQPDYNSVTHVASFKFRSYRFTQLLLADPVNFALSAKLNIYDGLLRKSADLLAHYVNSHGGWTVIGWHRRGVTTSTNGETELNQRTLGHLVRLEPTRQTDAFLASLRPFQFPLPELNN